MDSIWEKELEKYLTKIESETKDWLKFIKKYSDGKKIPLSAQIKTSTINFGAN